MSSFNFNQEGRLHQPSPEEFEQADKETSIIVYTDGMMQDGRPYYAYVAIRPSKYREFYAKCAARQPVVINEYGTIIEAGFEPAAPSEVQLRMQEMGFDPQMADKLTQTVKKDLGIFRKEQEEQRLHDIVQMLKNKENKATA